MEQSRLHEYGKINFESFRLITSTQPSLPGHLITLNTEMIKARYTVQAPMHVVHRIEQRPPNCAWGETVDIQIRTIKSGKVSFVCAVNSHGKIMVDLSVKAFDAA